MNRYARISAISGLDRDFIKNIKVLVIGAGAVGNELIKNLVLFGIKQIHIADFDKIEIHNLTRSVLFRESDIGAFKSEVAAKRASQLSDDTQINFSTKDFWDTFSFDDIKNYDAIICAVDNHEARINANTLANINDILFINTAIDHQSTVVEVFPFNNNSECSCYECVLPEGVYKRISDRYSCGWLRKMASKENIIPTTVVTAGIVAANACTALFDCLNNDNVKDSYRIFFDTKNYLSHGKINLPLSPSCISRSHIIKKFDRLKIKNLGNFDIKSFCKNKSEITLIFSDPILLYTLDKNKRKEIYFKRSKDFDESILLDNGIITKHAEINDLIDFDEYLQDYSNLKIPCKFFTIESGNNNVSLLLENEVNHG